MISKDYVLMSMRRHYVASTTIGRHFEHLYTIADAVIFEF